MKKIILAFMVFLAVTCLPSCGCNHRHASHAKRDILFNSASIELIPITGHLVLPKKP